MPGQAEIYYFSGTGNSLAVARAMAARLDALLIPIASVIDRERIRSDANVIGITFPVYYADLPNMVRRVAEKLDRQADAYVFGIATYGGAAGNSLVTLDRALRSRGSGLSAGFGVHMPQNAFHKPWENRSLVYRQAARRIQFVARSVQARRGGAFYSSLFLQWMLSPFEDWLRGKTAAHLEKLSNLPSPSGLSVEQLMPEADRAFALSEACTGCGLCARVCPVINIEIVDGRPVWQHRCENCLACFNWCPIGAIHGGVAASGYHYRHPDVALGDIAAQRRAAVAP